MVQTRPNDLSNLNEIDQTSSNSLSNISNKCSLRLDSDKYVEETTKEYL